MVAPVLAEVRRQHPEASDKEALALAAPSWKSGWGALSSRTHGFSSVPM